MLLQEHFKKRTLWELSLIVVYFLIATFFVLRFKLGYTETGFIYWGVPSIYISILKPQLIKKTTLYTLLMILPLSFIVDYMGHVSNSWYEPTALLGIRILGVFPADIFIWGFFYSYFVIAAYEYFFDTDKNKRIFSPKLKYLFWSLSTLIVTFSIIYFFNKDWLIIQYFYIVVTSTLFIIPFSLILYHYPKLFPKIVFQGFYFALLSLIFELTAIYLGQWHYIGEHYIGTIEIVGILFPFEEGLWILFAVPAYLCIYEFFADDRK